MIRGLTILLVIISTAAFSQKEFDISLGLARSTIKNIESPSNSSLSDNVSFSPSFGFAIKTNVSKRSLISFGIHFSKSSFNETISDTVVSVLYTSSGYSPHHVNSWYSIENVDINKSYKISWLSIPIYYGLKVSNWSFNGGVSISFYTGSSSFEQNFSGVGYDAIYNKKFTPSIMIFNLSFIAGISYNFHPRFAVNGAYYFGMNDLNSGPEKWKVNQLIVGFSFALIHSDYQKEKQPKD